MSPCQLLRAPRPTRPPLPCTCACAQLCVASRVTQRTRHHPEHLHVRVLVAHLCPRAPRNRVSISAVPPLGSRQAGTAPARGGPPPCRAELQPLLPAGRARGQPCRTAAGCPFCTVGVTLRASACGLLRGRAALWEETRSATTRCVTAVGSALEEATGAFQAPAALPQAALCSPLAVGSCQRWELSAVLSSGMLLECPLPHSPRSPQKRQCHSTVPGASPTHLPRGFPLSALLFQLQSVWEICPNLPRHCSWSQGSLSGCQARGPQPPPDPGFL